MPTAAPLPLVIVPTYNEAENIEALLDAVLDALPEGEILVVDDGSPDGTADRVARRQEATSRVHLLRRPGKLGLGTAYLTGFRWALERQYTHVFEMDADFSHDPKYLVPMLRAADEADLVVGSRYVAGGGTVAWSLPRRMLSRFGGVYSRAVLGMTVRDMTSGFKCYRRSMLAGLALDEVSSTGYAFQIEMKYRVHLAGGRIVELPIVFPDRVRGTSKMSAAIAHEAMLQVLRLRVRLRRDEGASD